jgi:alpha-glucosidase
MPTSCPPDTRTHYQTLRTSRPNIATIAFVVAVALAFSLTIPSQAQTLAQKNWAGSGVSVEAWWRHAVIYRIDPDRFQDTTGSGHGDLAGIAQRLDYIQSLGVDAILIDGPTAITPEIAGFDDLARAAVDHHLRLLVALPAPDSQAAEADAKVLAMARFWLNQGVAGLLVPTQAIARIDGAEHIAALLRQLHALAASVPGDRILLAAPPPPNPDAALVRGLAQSVQLTLSTPLALAQPTAANLRAELAQALAQPEPLLVAARVPARPTPEQQAALDRTVAAMLLASRAAILLDAGAELGLIPAGDTPPLMQWTPSNRTASAAPSDTAAVGTTPAPVDNSFHPYVAPLPRDFFPPPPMPEVVAVDHPVNPLLTPNALPGFTSGTLPAGTALNAATANVALEDTDPASLLSFYRRLIQMHHDNASLRTGLQGLLDHDADGALVWTRQSPASSRTGGSAFVVCNLSDKPLTLPFDALHLHANSYRTLLGAPPTRSGEAMTIPAWTVFLGEAAH